MTIKDDSVLRSIALAALRARREDRERALLPICDREPTGLFEFASRNRIAPIVAHALEEISVSWATEDWRRAHRESAKRMTIMLAELDSMAALLAREGIIVVALKNAGIARGLYPCAACCPMGDMDLLVERGRFPEAHSIIQDCGYRFASRSTVEPADLEQALKSGGTEYVKNVSGEEVWIELQWRPIAGRWLGSDQEPDGGVLLERSVTVAGSDVRLLNPADNMLQVSLHTAKHSYVRAPGLRLHTDVDRLTCFAPPEWGALLQLAGHLHVKTAVYFSLRCAADLLCTAVPQEALEALEPAPWKQERVMKWLRRADFFYPDERKFSRIGMMIFHACLYDDLAGLFASAMGTKREMLGWRYLPANMLSGVRRFLDLATRFQK